MPPIPAFPRAKVDPSAFVNVHALPFSLRQSDFAAAMEDVYDFFGDLNEALLARRLPRLEHMIRGALLSGLVSDLVTASLGSHARGLSKNLYPNGHPDLIVTGQYPNDAIKSGSEGVEIKATKKRGGAVDTHGARNQWMCVFVYDVDESTQPAAARRPLQFVEVYLAKVKVSHFRKNARGTLGTRTATLHAKGVKVLRAGMIYRLSSI